MLNDFFEQLRGRVPVDLLHFEKPRIEPGRKQVQKVGFDRCELWIHRKQAQQLPAHLHDQCCTSTRAVQAAQQLLTRRLGGRSQAHQRLYRRSRRVSLCSVEDVGRSRTKIFVKMLEESELLRFRQMLILLKGGGSMRRAVGLAACRQQPPTGSQELSKPPLGGSPLRSRLRHVR